MPKVLIIDDDIDALRIMQKILGKAGLEVDVIAHWHESFDRIYEFQPDIILLDILLAGVDGRHICRQLKSSPQTKKIPVILITASPDVAKNIGDSGADDYIEKPFTKEQLLQKIDHLTGQYSTKPS